MPCQHLRSKATWGSPSTRHDEGFGRDHGHCVGDEYRLDDRVVAARGASSEPRVPEGWNHKGLPQPEAKSACT